MIDRRVSIIHFLEREGEWEDPDEHRQHEEVDQHLHGDQHHHQCVNKKLLHLLHKAVEEEE